MLEIAGWTLLLITKKAMLLQNMGYKQWLQ